MALEELVTQLWLSKAGLAVLILVLLLSAKSFVMCLKPHSELVPHSSPCQVTLEVGLWYEEQL